MLSDLLIFKYLPLRRAIGRELPFPPMLSRSSNRVRSVSASRARNLRHASFFSPPKLVRIGFGITFSFHAGWISFDYLLVGTLHAQWAPLQSFQLSRGNLYFNRFNISAITIAFKICCGQMLSYRNEFMKCRFFSDNYRNGMSREVK